MLKTTFYCLLMYLISQTSQAQSRLSGFVGGGPGLENRIGFSGAQLQAGMVFGLTDHLSGSIGLTYFYGNKVHKWGPKENEGGYYSQFTPALCIEYSSGGKTGTGLLLSGGLAIRRGQTHHFETGDLHNGVFSNHRYITEPISGSGLILGIGYGIPLSQSATGKIVFSNHSFLMLSDQYSLSLQFVF